MNEQATVTPPILVAGGTGTLGRLVVRQLLQAGRGVRVLSRRARDPESGVEFATGDLTAGSGVEAAVDGVEIIIHCAGSSKGDDVKTQHLARAASRAGAQHLVYISVVGADRVPVVSRLDRLMFGYFASKRAAEQVVAEAGLPWTTLRATQFYDLVLLVARQMAKLPVIPVPSRVRFQPVDAGDVATRLVELAFGRPAGLVPDIAGPKIHTMADLLRSYLRATHRHRLLVPLRVPGGAARAVRAGANLSPDCAVGRRTWEDFLSQHVDPPAQTLSRAT